MPHSASSATPSMPVREALSTTPENSSSSSAGDELARQPAASRRSQSVAIIDHSSRLLRWLGWRRLPTARSPSELTRDPVAVGQIGREDLHEADQRAGDARGEQREAERGEGFHAEAGALHGDGGEGRQHGRGEQPNR